VISILFFEEFEWSHVGGIIELNLNFKKIIAFARKYYIGNVLEMLAFEHYDTIW